MISLRVLITNLTLAHRTGTELYVRDLALGLLRRGHRPIVFSPELGSMSDELLRHTVPVVDHLEQISIEPDVIHGHHTLETITAMLRFPRAPAIFVCHDWSAGHDTPPRLPQVRRYVAVDETCKDRLLGRHGTPLDRTLMLHNAVDLNRFQPRGPLPDRPRHALVLSNYASQRELAIIKSACASRGIRVDAVGTQFGNQSASPEDLLPQYDLVFAKGRCALEALACGAAVVVCDVNGCGPLVTSAELDRLRAMNLGRRLLQRPTRRDVILHELDRYDPRDAELVTQRIRAIAGLDRLLDQLLAVYHDAIVEGPCTDLEATLRAAADEFQHWTSQRINNRAIPRQEVPTPRLPWMPRMYRSYRKRLTSMREFVDRLTGQHSQRAA